ncbi:MAG: HAMP domain-containing sensor histidine kinase, partial [Oceanisphaera sp.]|nr:HAMP domain-containing sensor histidine kinase [Oceanisphaera sp.]
QRLRREAPDGPLQSRVDQIETSLRRLVRLSEKLMQLAKAEGGALVSAEPHDVVPVVRHVVDECRRTFDSGALRLSVPEQAPVFTTLDVDALAILVRNLLENALKYGDEQQPVTVSLSPTGLLRVSNGGPVVPAAILAGLTARFARAPGSHCAIHSSAKEGAGLGLAIVDAIARGAGGSLTLRSPASNRQDGFEAVVQLPG